MATRNKLVDKAFRLFLKDGYSGTGIAQILKQTGLSKGALYHHFSSKQELFAAVAEAHLPVPFAGEDWEALAEFSEAELKGHLVALYTEREERMADSKGSTLRHFSLFFEAIAHLPAYKAEVDEAYDRMMGALAAAIQASKGVDAAAARQSARLFLSTLEGDAVLRAVTTA